MIKQNQTSDRPNIRSKTTRNITYIIIGSGYAIIVGLAVLTVSLSGDDIFETSKWLFNVIVPLLAAWIGAVIAYYFGKDNYESATAQALALTRENLDDLNVQNIMIDVKTMVVEKVAQDQYQKTLLNEIMKLYNKVEKDRIPIFNPQSTPSFIIHRQSMKKYIDSKKVDEKGNLTLQNIIDDNKEKFGFQKMEGFVTVGTGSTIDMAKEKMKSYGCKDIFITDNGNMDGKVLGWLTDTLVDRFLRV